MNYLLFVSDVRLKVSFGLYFFVSGPCDRPKNGYLSIRKDSNFWFIASVFDKF